MLAWEFGSSRVIVQTSRKKWSLLVTGIRAGECLEAVSGELSFFTLPTCFELFGFDLVVDQDWHVWLLEVCVGQLPERIE